MEDSFALNKANWNDRAALHAASPEYQAQQFIAGADPLAQLTFPLTDHTIEGGFDPVAAQVRCHPVPFGPQPGQRSTGLGGLTFPGPHFRGGNVATRTHGTGLLEPALGFTQPCFGFLSFRAGCRQFSPKRCPPRRWWGEGLADWASGGHWFSWGAAKS